jgi:uncharacterized phage protein (TIGR01671 family)
MREVLFRGKTKTGFWIEGFLFQTTCDGVQEWCISSSPLSANDYSEILGDYGEVIPESISEFTGLTDKNGKKIFEGDILQIITGSGWTCPKGTKVYYEVVFTEFNPESASWSEYIGYMAKMKSGALRSLEGVIRRYGAVVVGNIHDNPELLKGGER